MDDSNHTERLVRIETKMENVLDRIEDLVSKQEFYPVKLLAYGLASGVLTAFLAALILKVIGNA